MRVLVAPLNWGLGHATRCIPIIHYLLQHQHHVHLAADGGALALLRAEFPDLPYTPLQGYDIQYPKFDQKHPDQLPDAPKRKAILAMTWAMLRQTPRILYRIAQEHKQTQRIVAQHKIDLVIADNRYGCYTAQTYNIFVCHQIFIQIPYPFAWLMPALAALHRLFIGRFDECWIPDYDNPEQALSGNLSRQKPLPSQYRFIGILSRFAAQMPNLPLNSDKIAQKIGNIAAQPSHKPISHSWTKSHSPQNLNALPNITLLALISGPEPQRTAFEQWILQYIEQQTGNILIVRGIADGTQTPLPHSKLPNVWVCDHLNAKALQQALLTADYVVARAGYSTIMDLVALNKKALLIPTPGQTEQLYLAQYLAKKGLFDINLPQTIIPITPN